MYFDNLKSVNEIKSYYRVLAMANHPDRNPGNKDATRIMQDINKEYSEILARCDGQTEMGSDDKEHTYHYNQEHEEAIMRKIDELLRLRLSGIDIQLIGKWVWVTGDTRPVKDALMKAKMIWHSKRLAWYWKPYYGKTHYNAGVDLDGLARYYGSTTFEQKESELAVR